MLSHVTKLLADATEIKLNGTIGGAGLGPFGNNNFISDPASSLKAITTVVSSVIGVMTIAGGIWFLFHILVAGFRWLGSEGDKTKLQEAQSRLTNAFVGLLIVVGGWSILALAGQFLGFKNILIPNPQELINILQIK